MMIMSKRSLKWERNILKNRACAGKLKRRKIMKKKFKLVDVDCANCAAKMEEAIKKIDGVTDASVSFMTQKMMIEADDEVFDKVLEEAIKCIARVEPDCKVVVK